MKNVSRFYKLIIINIILIKTITTYGYYGREIQINGILKFDCPFGTFYTPHEYKGDCTKFHECNNGTPTTGYCFPGTAFDKSRRFCCEKHKANCDYWSQTNYYNSTHWRRTEHILCPPNTRGVYPHSFHGYAYINCVQQKTLIHKCPKGTKFSTTAGKCIRYNNIDENNRKFTENDLYNFLYKCPTNVKKNVFYPFTPRKYVNCNSGILTVMECGDSKLYSISKRICLPETEIDTNDHVRFIQNNDIFHCPRKLFGVYPHPFSNEKYLKCVYGELHEKSCKSGNVYNFLTKFCEKDVVRNRTVLPSIQNKYNKESITEKRSNDSLTFLKCPLNLEGNFVHPYNCSQYINCSPFGTKIESCPHGSYFNLQREQCISTSKMSDFEHVECTTNDETVDTEASYSIPLGIYCSTNKTEKFAHPDNWHQYVLCENGKLKIEWCPLKQVFIFEELQCIDETEALEKY